MSNAHLDSAVLATLQDVMESEYPALLDTFLADSEERVRLLRQACQADQAEALRRLGCHVAQGWLVARAMPPEALREWCAAQGLRAVS